MKNESVRPQRAEKINRTLFRIASAVNSASHLEELYGSIHRILSSVIDTTNFYIALYDKSFDSITFPYCVDEVDGGYLPHIDISKTASLTGDVIRTRRPAMITKDAIQAWREQSGRPLPECSLAEIWLGVPLLVQQEVIGVMAVQSYKDPHCYDQTDMDTLATVAGQVALAIENKRTTDALQESMERYRTLADATFEAIFISEKGICIDTNQTASRMFGYPYQELIGIFGTDVIAPESKETVRQNMLSGYEEPYEVMAQRSDGSRFHAEICGKMMAYKGKNVRVTVVRDIDERKKAAQALKESELRFRELAELLPETIYEVDTEGKILFVNKNGLDQFGYSEDDLRHGLNAFEMLTPEDRQRAALNFSRTLAGESTGLSEYNAVRKNGDTFPIMLLSDTITRDAKPVGLRGIIIDLTERKKLETQLQHALKMEAIGTLAGGIAHDFNNILAAILGYAEMAAMDAPRESLVHQNLQHVLKASYRAKDLVEHILSFSRHTDLVRKPVLIAPILKEALKLLRASLPTTIAIQTDIDDGLACVESDPTQIHQIMMNLGANAGQAMGERGGTLSVQLEAVRLEADSTKIHPDLIPGHYQCLAVADTGSGIPKDIQERIFEPYFTTKGSVSGTGMGLAVVHGIAKSHGGAITVQSDGVRGSIFRVYLPELPCRSPDGETIRPEIPLGRGRILLVDDEEILTDMGSQMLKRLGYTVTATNSSMDALAMFKDQPEGFDLILTDMTMPEMTGDILAREVIALRPDMPVIICTGFNESMDPAKSEALGIRAYLMKPLKIQELATTIHRVLEEASPASP